jgi:uncharacterized beta-barrel protein YwiB (DUF1934 family)
MTKDVVVAIKGLHKASYAQSSFEDEEPIETLSHGLYYVKNGKEYVKYQEMLDADNGVSDSLMKIYDDKIEIIKSGAQSAKMYFDQNKDTVIYYRLPIGTTRIDVVTESIDIDRQEDHIQISLNYEMFTNGEKMSVNSVVIDLYSSHKAETLMSKKEDENV